ncbi:MFS general substrate transporter [Penicillium tannophilum]|nr:MFS general substrate transporter [Penicillium tannophilum]
MGKTTGEEPERTGIPYWRLIFDASVIPREVAAHHHDGAGTDEDPFQVTWIDNDARNPMNFGIVRKWMITLLVGINTLAVALVSSAYSGSLVEIIEDFRISEELGIVGISLFVVGFAVGPLIWAPLSEMYGRRPILIASSAGLTAFTAGCAGAQNIWTLLILRFIAGSLGSAPFAVAGGVIADCFPPISRGLASGLYCAAPFLGPTLGPIIGGFLSESAGWRWVEGLVAAFAGVLGIITLFFLPETFAPTLLKKRAERLSASTGHVYRSKLEIDQGKKSPADVFKVALSRPWVLLFREPIVLLLSIYLAIIYGILYMLFAAMPIVYQTERGWSEGLGGLSFLGITVGILFSVVATFPIYFNYKKKTLAAGGRLAPEQRLPGAMIGSIALPAGLFWFAWTNSPSIHWMASIAAGVPLGFGMVMVFLPILNYLIDAYTIYAASVLAANASLRSIFGAVFPLFTTYMYKNLGIHWASSIPAFLALACVPMPFLFYRYGPGIRKRCHYAATSHAYMEKLYEKTALPPKVERDEPGDGETASD